MVIHSQACLALEWLCFSHSLTHSLVVRIFIGVRVRLYVIGRWGRVGVGLDLSRKYEVDVKE